MAMGSMDEGTASGNGNEATITTVVLDAGVNEDQAWALVAGWIGPENHPRRRVEEWIAIVFEFEVERLRVEAAKNGRPHEITLDSGWIPRIRLVESWDEEDALATLKEQKRVARDMVVEKARSRVVRKLLGLEWRDPEEIALEIADADRLAMYASYIPNDPAEKEALVRTMAEAIRQEVDQEFMGYPRPPSPRTADGWELSEGWTVPEKN